MRKQSGQRLRDGWLNHTFSDSLVREPGLLILDLNLFQIGTADCSLVLLSVSLPAPDSERIGHP